MDGPVLLCFETERCIITGERPTVWCGHVVLKNMFVGKECSALNGVHDVSVLCGFRDSEIHAKAEGLADSHGCYGEWKKHYGIVVAEA